MPLVLYPEINNEINLPVFVSGIGVSCPQMPVSKAVISSHQLLVTVGGIGSVSIGSEQYEIPAGCGIYINKGVEYSCSSVVKHGRRSGNEEWLVDMISFSFQTEQLEKQLFTAEGFSFFRFRDPAMVSAALRRIHGLLMSDPKYGAYLASAELYTLLIKLNQETLDIPQLTQKASPVINSVIKYIDDNYTAEISLGDLCKAAGGISEQYLCRLFKQYTGERPIEFILHKRIGMARSYLEKTDMPISDVAKLTGFNNTSYFYRNFKKFVGISPLTCRQNSLKNAAASE